MRAPAPGTRYRVLKAFRSTDLKPIGPSAWTGDPYTFEVGDEIEYVDMVLGWGSDPAYDTVLKGADGYNHRVMSGWSVSPYLDPERGYTEKI